MLSQTRYHYTLNFLKFQTSLLSIDVLKKETKALKSMCDKLIFQAFLRQQKPDIGSTSGRRRENQVSESAK
jgi:hypothetical protein